MASLKDVERASMQRLEIDKHMSYRRYGGAVVSLTVAGIITVGLGFIALLFYQLTILFRLIKRRNQHFQRQTSFYEHVFKYLEEYLKNRDDLDLGKELDELRNAIGEIQSAQGGERSPWFWGVILPIAGLVFGLLYVPWFLMGDFYKHSRAQIKTNLSLKNFFRKAGLQNVALVAGYPLPKRRLWMYIVFTVLTFGAFLIYWYYILFKDPNEHFEEHNRMENHIIAALRMLSVT